jgi:hypothetical protein
MILALLTIVVKMLANDTFDAQACYLDFLKCLLFSLVGCAFFRNKFFLSRETQESHNF